MKENTTINESGMTVTQHVKENKYKEVKEQRADG